MGMFLGFDLELWTGGKGRLFWGTGEGFLDMMMVRGQGMKRVQLSAFVEHITPKL